MNITASIDPHNINPFPWWDHRSPFYIGDVPNPPYVVGDFPYTPHYPGNYRPTTGDSTTQYIHVEPNTIFPDWERTHTDNKLTFYDLSGKNITPKEKSVTTKDALGIALVVKGNEFMIIASVHVGTADTINAVQHFIGLRHPMPDAIEVELGEILYGDNPQKSCTWKVGDSLFNFYRTTLIMEQ